MAKTLHAEADLLHGPVLQNMLRDVYKRQLQQRRERDVLLALDDGEQQLRRQHLLLERRHRGIERRQEQAEDCLLYTS